MIIKLKIKRPGPKGAVQLVKKETSFPSTLVIKHYAMKMY
jgi:hypothetical protein